MKKTLLTFACALFALCGFAQSTTTYTDDLVVTINEESIDPQPTDILVTANENGTYTLALNNFMLGAEGDALGVGNIKLTDIEVTEENGIKTFKINQIINITNGDKEGIEEWIGPYLGDVPIELNGKMTDEKLYCTIGIDMMSTLEQIIYVVFGTDDFNTTPKEDNTNLITTYSDNLVVTINEESIDPQPTDILVTANENGTYTLALNNFMLGAEGDALGVGNIKLTDIEVTEENGIKTFKINQIINITNGDKEGIEEWIGPYLGDVPIELNGKMTDEKLYCTIDIDMMSTLEQIIYVVFGTDDFKGSNIANIENPNALVNVYNLQGVVVKKNVKVTNALDGLNRGIYIVNGKKVTK